MVEGEGGIIYLTGSQAKSISSAGIYMPSYSYRDRWGNPYEVYWDANYDGKVTNPLDPTMQLSKGVVGIGRGISPSFSSQANGLIKSW